MRVTKMVKRIKVLMVENGRLVWKRVYDYGSFLAYPMEKSQPERWLAWAKGKPLLYRRKYTYLITPEVAWTLGAGDMVTILKHGKPPDYFEAIRIIPKDNILPNNQGNKLPPPPPPNNLQANGGSPNGYDAESGGVEGQTFNPSELFNDKTQAEWFGNIIKNVEANAIKGIVSAGQKIPKGTALLILAIGGLLGLFCGLLLASLGKTTTHPQVIGLGLVVAWDKAKSFFSNFIKKVKGR